MRTKYIVFDGPLCYPVIFPEFIDHKEMANKIGHPVLSAGFVEIQCDRLSKSPKKIGAYCYGNSNSLDKSSRPAEDNKILTRMLVDN
jgi:hypothetical protein